MFKCTKCGNLFNELRNGLCVSCKLDASKADFEAFLKRLLESYGQVNTYDTLKAKNKLYKKAL